MLGRAERTSDAVGRGVGLAARRWFAGLAAGALAVCLSPRGAIAGSGASAGAAGAGVPPSYGHTFLTVGAPGNRAMLPVERYYNSNHYQNTLHVGAVNYTFRIAQTEVTSVQWLDFVRVAWPAWQAQGWDPTDPRFYGSSGIIENGVTTPNYIVNPGREQWGVRSSWRAAAMYCNWLHNGRPTGASVPMSAFLSGAYDVSTFTRNPNGSYNDQVAHSPDAKYWIPTLDEWTKAAYFDPNRYAPGNPGPTQDPGGGPPITGDTSGYWLWPHATQVNPTPDLYSGSHANVGLHPDVRSPWGLLDIIGTVTEWTETVPFPPATITQNRNRFARSGDPAAAVNDDFFFWYPTDQTAHGLRIASLVPAPGIVLLIAVAIPAATRRRGRLPH